MAPDGKRSISLDEALFNQLKELKEDRGETWDQLLEAACSKLANDKPSQDVPRNNSVITTNGLDAIREAAREGAKEGVEYVIEAR